MRILVLGHARHGKDTVGEFLQLDHGLRTVSSSLFLAETVMVPYFAARGETYASLDACYADRVNRRQEWFEEIARYNREDPARTAREILDGADVYVGMRSPIEFEASRALFDRIVWVDASGRGVPPEPVTSCGIAYDPETMDRIRNDGTVEDLRATVFTWMIATSD